MTIVKKTWPWILVSMLVVAGDQLTKYAVVEHIGTQQVIKIFPFLNLILRFNTGAAFSFLGAQNGWQVYLLSGISIVASVVLFVWLCRLKNNDDLIALPISLVLGGAVGNLVDRLHWGFVVDFVDFHIRQWHFATFNVADAAVSMGATWLVLRLVYESIISKS